MTIAGHWDWSGLGERENGKKGLRLGSAGVAHRAKQKKKEKSLGASGTKTWRKRTWVSIQEGEFTRAHKGNDWGIPRQSGKGK